MMAHHSTLRWPSQVKLEAAGVPGMRARGIAAADIPGTAGTAD